MSAASKKRYDDTRPYRYSGKTLFDSNLESVQKKIDCIYDIDKLKELLEEEKKYYDRVGFYNKVKLRIAKIERQSRIMKEGLIDLDVFDRLVNKIPWCDPDKGREPLNNEIRSKVFERDNQTCQLCKGNSKVAMIQCHHVIPNGSATEDNLISLCPFCHDKIHMFLSKKGYRYYVPRR